MVAVNLKGDAMTDNLQKRPTCNRISMLALGTAALLGATALAVPSSASAFGFGGHFGGGFANRSFATRGFAPRSFVPHNFADRNFASHSFASHSFANSSFHSFGNRFASSNASHMMSSHVPSSFSGGIAAAFHNGPLAGLNNRTTNHTPCSRTTPAPSVAAPTRLPTWYSVANAITVSPTSPDRNPGLLLFAAHRT
jgi:hypothetical protein